MTTPAGDVLYATMMLAVQHAEPHSAVWVWWNRVVARLPLDIFV